MECKCNKCGMEVKGMCCGKCNAPLKKDTINGNVQVAKCPNGCGMIKAPVCCGENMECSIK